MLAGLSFSASLKSNVLWCCLHLQAEVQAYLLPAEPSQRKGSSPHPHFRSYQTNPLIEFHLNSYSHVLLLEPIAVAREKQILMNQAWVMSTLTPETKRWGEVAFPKGNQEPEEGVTDAGEPTYKVRTLILSLLLLIRHVSVVPPRSGGLSPILSYSWLQACLP